MVLLNAAGRRLTDPLLFVVVTPFVPPGVMPQSGRSGSAFLLRKVMLGSGEHYFHKGFQHYKGSQYHLQDRPTHITFVYPTHTPTAAPLPLPMELLPPAF